MKHINSKAQRQLIADFLGQAEYEPLTPSQLLLSAAGQGDRRTILHALKKGADVTARGSGEATALHYVAAMGWGRELIEPLVQAGADISARDMRGFTPLHEAAMGGWKDTVETLVELGADVTARDDKGRTAGEIAKVQYERIRVLEEARQALLQQARSR